MTKDYIIYEIETTSSSRRTVTLQPSDSVGFTVKFEGLVEDLAAYTSDKINTTVTVDIES